MTDPFFRPLSNDARILIEFEGRPLERYAIMLQLQIEGRWQTIRLLDNAHGDHDMHRYTGGEKQPAERFAEGAVNESVLDQFPDVSPPGTPTRLLSFAEIREARRRRSERLAKPHAVEREDESGCRSCQFVCAVEYGNCGPVDGRVDCSFGSRGEAKL